MSEINLKPCPFCGSKDPELHPVDIASCGMYIPLQGSDAQYAHCNGCGADGPQSFHADEAIKLWNRRAHLSTTTDEETRA